MPETDTWFLLDRGKTAGPYTLAQLEEMRRQGVCNPFSKVSRDREKWVSIDDMLNMLNEKRAEAARPAPLRPPPLSGMSGSAEPSTGESAGQRLTRIRSSGVIRPFPVFPLLLLHFLTGGLFTFFWVTTRHGQLPRARADDPSATKALGLCFIPFFNLYWFFVVCPRLATRVNSLNRRYKLEPTVPMPLSYALCLLVAVPALMSTAGSVVLMFLLFSPTSKFEAAMLFFVLPNVLTVINFVAVAPIFAARVQQGINQLFEAQIAELQAGG